VKACQRIGIALLVVQVGSGGSAAAQAGEPTLPEGPRLAAKHPGDRGIEKNPAVICVDGFESADPRA